MPRGVVENIPRRARVTEPRYRIRNRVVNEPKRMKFVAIGQHRRNDRGGLHGRLRSGSGQAFHNLVYTDHRAGRGLLCKARPTLMQGLRYSWRRETCCLNSGRRRWRCSSLANADLCCDDDKECRPKRARSHQSGCSARFQNAGSLYRLLHTRRR